MSSGNAKQFPLQRLLVLVILLGACAQPAHTVLHQVGVAIDHNSPVVWSLSQSHPLPVDWSNSAAHDHSTELCGQCQLGFMGAALPTEKITEAVPANSGADTRILTSYPPLFSSHAGNRDPPSA